MSRMERQRQDELERALRNQQFILNGGAQPQPNRPPEGFLNPIECDNWHPVICILKMGLKKGRDPQTGETTISEVYAINQFGGASKRLELVKQLLPGIKYSGQDPAEDVPYLTWAFDLADKVLAMEKEREAAKAADKKEAA